MKKKNPVYTIQVRMYPVGKTHHTADAYEVVETIQRSCWAEQIGNFNPLFCRYLGERHLVHSDAGDLSDPFRREESYTKSLFIEIHA